MKPLPITVNDVIQLSDDGNVIAFLSGASIYVYEYDSSTTQYVQKGSTITFPRDNRNNQYKYTAIDLHATGNMLVGRVNNDDDFHQLEGQILRSMISLKKKPGFKEEARIYMMKTGDRMKVM